MQRRTIKSPDPELAGVTVEEDADSFSFFAPRPKAYANPLRGAGATLDERGVRLVYPKNFNFIREVRADRLRRLTKLGLDPQKLLVFEIPYTMGFYLNLDPALAATDFQLLKRQSVYFRSLVFTKGYIDQTSPIDLEDTVLHEQMHLTEWDETIRSGTRILKAEDRPAIETRTERLVGEKLGAKYGDDLVHEIKLKSEIHNLGQQTRREVLSAGFLNFWLCRFIRSRFESMEQSSQAATDALLHGGFAGDMDRDHGRVREMYREVFAYRLDEE
jgi:hypothetical protein